MIFWDICIQIRYFQKGKNCSINKLVNPAGILESYLRDNESGNKTQL